MARFEIEGWRALLFALVLLVLALLGGMGLASNATASSSFHTSHLGQTQPSTGGTGGRDCNPCWSVVPSPGGTPNAGMRSVVVVSANDIWAIGSQGGTSTGNRTSTLHWDGSAWTTIASPNVGTGDNELWGAAATSSSDVWAVGRYYDTSWPAFRNLILHWNGSAWSVVFSPTSGKVFNMLSGVTAFSPTNAWAVGDYVTYAGAAYATQVLHWNGTSWAGVASPNRAGDNALWSVSAFSPTDMWAVGAAGPSGSVATLTLHWNGASWSMVASPTFGSRSQLQSVSVIPGTGTAMAVGYSTSGAVTRPLALFWNGAVWAATTVPTSGTYAYFNGVVAVSSAEVWAVGTSDAPGGPFAARWDGSVWTLVPGASVPGLGSGFSGVAAVGPGNIWSAGSYEDAGQFTFNLIEHYCCR